MDIMLGAVSAAQVVAGAPQMPEMSTDTWKAAVYWGALLILAIAGLSAIVLRKKRKSGAEDSVYEVNAITIARQSSELEAASKKIRELQEEVYAANTARNQSDYLLSKATAAAEIASDAAKRASDAADDAMRQMASMRTLRDRDRDYIVSLRAQMVKEGITPIEEPK